MIKKLIRGIGLMSVCLFLFPLSVLAADKSVTLSETDDGVKAFVELPSTEDVNPVTSLQMSFQVEVVRGNAEQAKAEFFFNEEVQSSVKEYRYHEDTGILTIYISGTENLFSKEKLELGELIVSSEDALGVKAKISVVEDSYVFVSEGGTETETETINAPGVVEVTVGKGGVEEETPQPPEEGEPLPPTPEEGNPKPPVAGNDPKPQGDQGDASGQSAGTTGSQSQNVPANTGDGMQPMRYLSIAAAAGFCLILLKVVSARKEK